VIGRPARVWIRRGVLAAILVGAAVIPGRAAVTLARACAGVSCRGPGQIRWVRRLPGDWVAASAEQGTVPVHSQAYVAVGGGVATVAFGTKVLGYRVSTGKRLWSTVLTGLPAGTQVISVRAWPGVVTAGVNLPARQPGRRAARQEVVLSASTGKPLRSYPAAEYGGAVAADLARTVIVGTTAVTSYANATGRVLWRRPTGRAAQAWAVDGASLYVTVAAEGYLGTSPVTALRQVDLQTGAERLVRPGGSSFAGTLSGALGGVLLFSGSGGLSAYSALDGSLLWRRQGVVPEMVDAATQTLYVASGSALFGLDPATGTTIARAGQPGSAGLYAVRNGVGLGLDLGALGDAWGYSLAERRVVWTTSSLPWPHYFVDLTGLAGSAEPGSSTILLTSCGRVGSVPPGGEPRCLRPDLVAIKR
jgi:hypothetical protein